MTRNEAKIWYAHYLPDCTGFESYYKEWKTWFNDNPLPNKLASTPEASCTTADWSKYYSDGSRKEEEGNNPMSRFDDVCYAAPKSAVTAGAMAITVQAPAVPSDEMTQRKFLMEELSKFDRYEWQAGSATSALRKLFNLDAPKYPATSQALLDAFKSGAFEVDQAKVDKNAKLLELDDEDRYDDEDDFVGERFYGIKFTGLPVPDQKGFDAAKAALEALKVDTKRSIMVGSPADGLAALKALEAWTPTGPTVH